MAIALIVVIQLYNWGEDMERMVCCGVFCGIVAVLASFCGCSAPKVKSQTRILTAVPAVAEILCEALGENSGYQVKTLLSENEGCGEYVITEWDEEEISRCAVYVSIGLPFEEKLIARNTGKDNIMIVPLDERCTHLAGNPYVWTSYFNRMKMFSSAKAIFGFDMALDVDYWQIEAYLALKKRLEESKYAVAVTHKAFEYECENLGVRTVFVDSRKLNKDDAYTKMIKQKIGEMKINLVLSMPGYQSFADEISTTLGCRLVAVDVFRDDGLWKIPFLLREGVRTLEGDIKKRHAEVKSARHQ